MTTLADFDRFIAEVTAARDSAGSSGPAADGLGNPPVDAAVPTTRSRLRDIARAELELDRRRVYVDPPKKKSRMKHGATDMKHGATDTDP